MSQTAQLDTRSQPLRIERMDEARLRSLVDAWRAIGPDPFTSPDFVLPWWDAFGGGRRLTAWGGWDGERLVALLPLVERRGRLEAPVNYHTPYFDVAQCDEAARALVVRHVLDSAAGTVVLDALPEGSPTIRQLLDEPGARRAVIRDRHRSPIVDTSVDRETFRQRTRAQWKTPIDRLHRKMVREQGASFHLVEQPEEFASLLDAGFALEASGWKGAGGTAIASQDETARFYISLARAFAARGQLALSWIDFDDQMVAFDLSLLVDGRLYLLKTAYDEAHRRLAPGLVLRLAVIERCIELGIPRHELLGDDGEWKRKFAQEARQHVEIRLYRRGPVGSAGWGYRRFLRPRLRDAYRGLRDRVDARR